MKISIVINESVSDEGMRFLVECLSATLIECGEAIYIVEDCVVAYEMEVDYE